MTTAALIHLSLPFTEPQPLLLRIAFSCTHANCIITHTAYQSGHPGAEAKSPQLSEPLSMDFAKRIADAIQCYIREPEYRFSLSCDVPLGTPFQQRVWQALTEIPAGEVMTYGALAKQLNSSARAVGNACRQNRFPLLIPCHRVVSAAGIGGYAGDTLEHQRGEIHFLKIKQWLLSHEHVNIG